MIEQYGKKNFLENLILRVSQIARVRTGFVPIGVTMEYARELRIEGMTR